MNFFVMRHGDAEKNIVIRDKDRTLTKKGFYDLEKLSLYIKKKKSALSMFGLAHTKEHLIRVGS